VCAGAGVHVHVHVCGCAALTDMGETPEMQVGGKEGVCVQVQVCMCTCAACVWLRGADGHGSDSGDAGWGLHCCNCGGEVWWCGGVGVLRLVHAALAERGLQQIGCVLEMGGAMHAGWAQDASRKNLDGPQMPVGDIWRSLL